MMNRCVLTILSLIYLTGVLCDPVTYTPVAFSGAQYIDPLVSEDEVLLNVNVVHPCVSELQVIVHIPTTTDPAYGNAHYSLSHPYTPTSSWSGAIHGMSGFNGVKKNTTVHVAWNTTHLIFSHFIAGESAKRVANSSSNEVRWALNFEIPASIAGPGKAFPLFLVLNDDQLGITPLPQPGLTLTDFTPATSVKHFTVLASNDTCLDGTVQGDPVFAGFQGQNFQFHGLPDEHFNLISSADVQLNSHFVYLSSGKCDYTDTACFSHAGTYMDALGLSVADARLKVVAGTHKAGLRIWLNDEELHRGAHIRHMSDNVTTSSLRYHHNGKVEVHTDLIRLEIVNSDMFFNIRVGLNDKELLRTGAIAHTVTDHAICKSNIETSNHQLVEQVVAKKYGITTPLHGLIGQTWRNVKVCGRDWMGTVEDYVVSDLFATDNHYNYFNW